LKGQQAKFAGIAIAVLIIIAFSFVGASIFPSRNDGSSDGTSPTSTPTLTPNQSASPSPSQSTPSESLTPSPTSTPETNPHFTDALWEKKLPLVEANSVIQTSDGGYLVVGQTGILATVIDPIENWTYWADTTGAVAKTDTAGTVQWSKNYSVTNVYFALQTSDGGYMLFATQSVEADFPSPFTYIGYSQQFCLVKIDSQGNPVWTQIYDRSTGEQENIPHCFIQTSDGGYALVGTASYPTHRTDYHTWFVKVDAQGHLQWNKTIEIGNHFVTSEVIQNNDGDFVLFGGDPSMRIIAKLTAQGDILWHKTYGGTGDYYWGGISSVVSCSDGYVIAGSAFPQNSGADFVWIFKVNFNGDSVWSKTYNFPNYAGSTLFKTLNGYTFLVGWAETQYESSLQVSIVQTNENGDVQSQPVIKNADFRVPFAVKTVGGYVSIGIFSPEDVPSEVWLIKIGA
jgi:hypothetical protein